MTGFSKQVRDIIRHRASVDGFWSCEVMVRCQGRAMHWEIHHRRPRGMGGTNRHESNLPAAGLGICRDCHHYIELNREISLANGWLVRQNQTPCEIPVLRRHVWVLLDNRGGFERANCVCGEINDGGWYPGVCVCMEEQ